MAIPTTEKPKPAEKCTLGCPVLDHCLAGGVPCASVTEIVAESASGKTQLCLQLALSAQLPRSHGGLSAASLYLHTEFPFPSRRLRQLSLSFRRSDLDLDPNDNVFVHAVHSVEQLLEEIPKVTTFVSASRSAIFPVRVLIVDSIAALFRSEFDNTASDLRRRASLFFKISAELRGLARRFDLAIVVTNQVADFFGEDCGVSGLRIGNLRWLLSSGRRVCPALGLAWANCVNSRLFLSREEEVVGEEDRQAGLQWRTRRRIHVLFAPHLPDSSTEFVIRREGIFGV